MLKLCIISQQKFSNKHVSEDTVDAFEKAIMNVGTIETLVVNISEIMYKVNRKLKNVNMLIDFNTIRKIKSFNPDVVFIMAMSPVILKYEMSILERIKTPKVVYCIDTWESRINEWEYILKKAKIDYVLCSNKKTVDVFSAFCKKARYLPYSMNGDCFYPRNSKKTHLFMQMGRKNATLHEYVLRYLREYDLSDIDYIREKERGQIIYPSFEQLAQEINKTMFFVLAPRDAEEKSITGAISDVTARFYEGMACKTMLIGYKPKDTFDSLFPDENAMIEVDSYESFRDNVNHYRSCKKEYYKIVDANYRYLIENHTWCHRANELVSFAKDILTNK